MTQVEQTTWSVGHSMTIPIYQGGDEYSLIRQSKESWRSNGSTSSRCATRHGQTIAQAWGLVEATKAQIESAQAQVRSSETALNGVREEARVGQRTTLDVLNAQQVAGECPSDACYCAARPGRGILQPCSMPSEFLEPTKLGLEDADLRPAHPLPSDARQLVGSPHPGWQISHPVAALRRPALFSAAIIPCPIRICRARCR